MSSPVTTPANALKRNPLTYGPDRLSPTVTLVAMAAAAVGAAVFTVVAWIVLDRTSLPAFGPSNVTRALATACMVAALIPTVGFLVLWLRDTPANTPAPGASIAHTVRVRPRWRHYITCLLAYLSPAVMVVALIGIPLAPTKLYLDGISVDQGFRTQYLTRLTDTWHLSDMNYVDLPSFYPGGWFWLGGRFANLMGLAGWEAFQPWSLVTLAAAGSLLVPVWQRLLGSLPLATAIALCSTVIVLITSAEEPYAAVIALGIPAAAMMAYRGLSGNTFAIAGVVVFLGISATFYTLYTAVAALSVVLLAIVVAFLNRSFVPTLLRLLVIGFGSLAIAAVVWAPYLLARLRGEHASRSTAQHYLPLDGAAIPTPMFALTLAGLLCLVGMVYLIVRVREPEIMALTVSLVVAYGWVLASMFITLLGTTLLGFRLNAVVIVVLVTAGILAIAEARLVGVHRLYPSTWSVRAGQTVTVALVCVLSLGFIQLAQSVPNRQSHAIDLAFTDTDGFGQRADRYPADAGQYYAAINEHILATYPDAANTVVLTDEKNFMSYYPYRGFQAITSHYANPLGEFELRNAAIEDLALRSWEDLSDPQAFLEALDNLQWRSPDVILLQADADNTQDGWNYDISEDIYPNNPNVRFRGVRFNPAVFDSSEWTVTQIGPFVSVVRAPR